MKGLEKELKENQIILFLIPAKEYDKKLKEMTNILSRKGRRICYITLRKPATALLQFFGKKNIYFVDATPAAEERKGKNIIPVSSPRALSELNIETEKTISEKKINILIFDSLSALAIYQTPFLLTKFSHNLITSLRVKGIKGIFVCSKEDEKSNWFKDITMFVDKIISIS